MRSLSSPPLGSVCAGSALRKRFFCRKAGSPVPDGGRERSHTPGLSQVSKVLLLSMFALASRYLEQPSAEGLGRKMWEIGCNYALDAREILSACTGTVRVGREI